MSLPTPVILTQTSSQTFLDGRPCFSPDGTTVLFMRSPINVTSKNPYQSSAGPSAFYQVSISQPGTEQEYLSAANGPLTRPDWSWAAGNNYIAFTPGGETSGDQVGLIKAKSNTEPGKVTMLQLKGYSGPMNISYPSWYPDGKHLAVTNYADNQLMKISDKGVWQSNLTDTNLVWSGMCSVNQQSSDNICMAAQPPSSSGYQENNNNIYTQDSTKPPALFSAAPPGVGRAAWWSPDGSWIAYEGSDGSGSYQVYLQEAGQDSSKAIVVTDSAFGIQHPKWSVDGNSIVYAVACQQAVPNNPTPWQIEMIDVSSYVNAS